ncbi:suppressor protein SRP40-like [Chenopodium quinoa]|uniref:suppressor protein SRP40-like n=1 Tax=Chenopodium quinoa TaxID=63459 RepID=UPI000B78EA0D|nr:suppressor protein SRP40-like [Chenopodium quinoa]
MVSQSHAARHRIVISQSPGTDESRTSSAECLASDPALRTSPNPIVYVSVLDTMARTKRTARKYNSDGSFYHSDGSTVYSDDSIRAPTSEVSEHPNSPSYLPPTLTYYHSSTSSGTPSDGILGEADEQYRPGPSGQAPKESLGEDPAGPRRRSPSSDESSDDESTSSSSSENASITSEEARTKIDSARESLAVDRGENKAMEKISASRKPALSAARYRSNVLNKTPDEQKPVGTPKGAPTKPSPSKPSDPKLQKVRAGDEKLEPLQEANKEAERAKQRVTRLEQRLSNQEKQLKTKYESRADQEREALVKQMMDDNEAIMRAAWAAVQLDSDYQTCKSKFDEASKEFDARLIEEAENVAKADAAAEEGSRSDSSGESSSSGEEGDQAEEVEKNEEEQPKDNWPAANAENLP